MIFEILYIISYILRDPYIVSTIQTFFNTPPAESFFGCPAMEITDLWDSLAEEEYIEDILENSCEDTDCTDYVVWPFDIFGNTTSDYTGHYYKAGGKTKHCIVLKQ